MSAGTVRFHVADQAVARVAARAARRVPGVVALRADLQQTLLGIAGTWMAVGDPVPPELRTEGVVVAVHDGVAEVRVTVVTRLGHRARDLATAVRVAVASDVHETTGLTSTVEVTIADIELD